MTNPFRSDAPPPLLTVSELNSQARALLESHFGFIWVEGEVSNFARPSSGHWYFSLKDGDAQVRCAMFRGRNQRMQFTPANGDAIRLRCRVSLYEGRGEFQLLVEHLEHAGAGALQAAFEALKAKLAAEGLFDAQRKQPLPAEVAHLGVVTSASGAALHDILTVLRRRCPAIAVSLLPVPVQGDGAAAAIAAAIKRANRWQAAGKIRLDALIVGRGGGSLEDLWAFNEEVVARAIAASRLPVVSAVGHEVDFSIADLVADQRAPTPSAAAELLSPDQREWREQLDALEYHLRRAITHRLAERAGELRHLRQRLKHPGARLREQAQRLDDMEQRLVMTQRHALQRHRSRLALLASRIHGSAPGPRLARARREAEDWHRRLHAAMSARLRQASAQLGQLVQVLDSLSPLATLQRGYAILSDSEGRVVRDAAQVNTKDRLEARLARGRLQLEVKGRLDDPA